MVWFVLAVHLLVDLALWILPLHFTGTTAVVVWAWPLAQASLLGWWAALSTQRFYLRFAAAAAGTAFAWVVLMRVLPVVSIYSRVGAAVLLSIATQTALTMLAVVVARSLCPRWACWLGESGDDTSKIQYDVGSLLLLTAAVAVVMSLLQITARRFAWSEVAESEFFLMMPAMGTLHAVYGFIALASLAGRQPATQRVARIAGGAALVALLGYVHPWLLRLLYGHDGGMPAGQRPLIALAQAAFMIATLLPIAGVTGRRSPLTGQKTAG